jgi:hypothetical protein
LAQTPSAPLARDFAEAWARFAAEPVLGQSSFPVGEGPYLVWLVRLPVTPGIERLRRLLDRRRWQLPDDWLHMTVQEIGFRDPPDGDPPPSPNPTLTLGPPNVLTDAVVLEVRGSGLDAPFRLPHVSVLYSERSGPDPQLRDLLARAREDWQPDTVAVEALELVAVDFSRRFAPWTTLERMALKG